MTDGSSVAERFRLLATALARRPIAVVATEGRPYTDGALIAVDAAAPTPLMRAQVALHALLLAEGSLDVRIMRRLLTRQATTARYLLVEGVRLRDTVMADKLPIVARTLAGPGAPRSDGPADSLRIALSRQVLPATPEEWGVIRPAKLYRARASDEPPSTHPPVLDLQFPPPDQLVADEPDSEDGRDGASGAFGMENPFLSRMLRSLFNSRSRGRGGKSNPGFAAEYMSSSRGGIRGGVSTRLISPPSVESSPTATGAAAVLGWCPEWDVRRGRYRDAWCRVVQTPPPATATGHAMDAADLRFVRRLARVGLSAEPRRHEAAGEDLDLDAVVRYRVDIAAGSDPGDRIWRHRSLTRRDLAVMVLLDASGSAGEGGGHTVLERHAAMATVIVESLQRLGARVGAASFTGHGRWNVCVTRLRHFDEHGTGRFRARLAAVEPGGFTRLGAAIRHSANLLRQEGGALHQLLVVLSDGLPYDEGYEGRYAIDDTRRAITEAMHSGVGCLCLSYSDAPAEAFEPATAATFATIKDLEPRIGVLFKSALKATDRRRRYAPTKNSA